MTRYRQRDVTDCGAVCFVYVCDHYGLRLPVARVRQALGTDQSGTTAAGMVCGARQLGFSARGVKGPVEALGQVPLPAIAHCVTEQKLMHYVVLVEWTKRRARVMDPASGRVETWRHDRFRDTWTGVLILLAPADGFVRGNATCPPWRRLWQLVQPHRSVFLQAIVGAIVVTVLGLGTSVYVQQIVDAVIPGRNLALLNLLGVTMVLVAALKLVLSWLQSRLSLRIAQRIDAALILAYHRHLLRLPQPFFDTMRIGEITSRIGDAVKIRNFLNQSLLALLLNPLIVAFSISMMFWWSWKLGLLSLALIPAYSLIHAVLARLNRAWQRGLMERAADFEAGMVESLAAQPVIRSFGLEAAAETRGEARLVGLMRAAWASAVGACAGATVIAGITQLHTIALLWLGASLVLRSEISPGQLMCCYTLAGYLSGPVTALIGLNSTVQEALVATERLFEVMDLEREADPGTIELRFSDRIAVRFERVGFKHPGRSTGISDLDLTLSPGEITALTGPSGCGKSTVLALLQRLHSPDTGRILIGSRDLRYFTLASVRRNFSVVPQHTRLLAGSIAENLAPGEYQPDLSRLLEVARQAGILEFIEKLPQGFLTPLGENGVNLSGGQRQRIALARALYRDAPVLLLDEPSSALDPESERQLVSVLQALKAKDKIVVVATHSSKLIGAADREYLLENGRLAPSSR